jgi:murein DD-endopeptidase MepM/ murein hydrolase activator NlpD
VTEERAEAQPEIAPRGEAQVHDATSPDTPETLTPLPVDVVLESQLPTDAIASEPSAEQSLGPPAGVVAPEPASPSLSSAPLSTAPSVSSTTSPAPSDAATAASAPNAEEASAAPRRSSGPIAQAVLWLAMGCIAIGVGELPLAYRAWQRSRAADTVATATTSAAPSASATPTPAAASSSGHAPIAFRAAALADDPEHEVTIAIVGKRTCAQTLEALGLSPAEIASFDALLRPLRSLASCDADDRVVLARRRSDKSVLALEIETAPGAFVRVIATELAGRVLHGGADAGSMGEPSTDAGTPSFVVERVELPVSRKRMAVALVVETELEAALANAGLDGSLLDTLDAALESRSDLPPITRGTVLRVVADSTWVDDHFDRWDELVALEIRPTGTPKQATPVVPGKSGPVRLYHLREHLREADAKAMHAQSGFWDGRAQQPMKGKWRMPMRFPRISSRFNPRRMHPVLHVVMPHNGCDFAAKAGTPVYAIGAGTVQFVGEAGPSGNLITIAHDGAIESGYAHLSRFAPGIAVGTAVEARTLIGYVGTTGRSTGPHLHLSTKRNGAFIDPLSLKLDGFRVVPPSARGPFAKRKAEADAALDAIEIPEIILAPLPSTSASPGDEPPAGEEAPK